MSKDLPEDEGSPFVNSKASTLPLDVMSTEKKEQLIKQTQDEVTN